MTGVLVCVKRVPDVSGEVLLTADAQSVDARYVGFTVSAHESCAVELAVQVGEEITALTLGPAEAVEQLRSALGVGCTAAVFSVAGHAVEAQPATTPTAPAVHELTPDVAPADLVAHVVSTEPGEPDRSGSLRSARVVVGAGRGAGGADGFDGVIGVSRVVTSLGWRPHHEQVGQTGSRISPGRLHPVRHQRGDPALGGLRELADDRRDQHRPGRPDGDQGHLRRDRRHARDRARRERGDPQAARVRARGQVPTRSSIWLIALDAPSTTPMSSTCCSPSAVA
jgi:hypothetical protein